MTSNKEGYQVNYPASLTNENLALCPLDQLLSPRVISRRLLIFQQTDSADFSATRQLLEQAFHSTVKAVPFLATVIVSKNDPSNAIQDPWEVRPASASLFTSDLRTDSELDLETLRNRSFPTAALTWAKLGGNEVLPDVDNPVPAFVMQATFVPNNGIILSFAVNHIVMDGTGTSRVIEIFADRCRALDSSSPPMIIPTEKELDRKAVYPWKWDEEPSFDSMKLPAPFEILDHPPPAPKPIALKTPTDTNIIFCFKKEAVAQLKTDASVCSEPVEGVSYISSLDSIFALLWRSIMAARHKLGIIRADDEAGIWLTMNIRSKFGIPVHYIGNMILFTQKYIPVSKLIGNDGLANAAHMIRGQYTNHTDKEDLEQIIKAFTKADRPSRVTSGPINRHTSDCFTTSWRSFDYKAFDWGSTLGTFETFRMPDVGMTSGVVTPYPPRSDGIWEVGAVLDGRVIELLSEDKTLLHYCHHMIQ
jgi:hypothetical protein